ncbi:Neuroligin-4, X-linked [Lamellibrachia satsuma]|nr:Neuroligin-4, X-linked [Lamellibrachia satsuma]
MSPTVTITAILVLSTCHLVATQQRWRPLWDLFSNAVVVRTYYGDVRGFSVPWDIEDTVWDRKLYEYPPWYMRRINCFLGIPYALPPLGYLRFQRPHKPRWYGTYEANYFRPACPQRIDSLREDIPGYPKANISEDCLYMNIYAPNVTTHSDKTLYPVMVLATREVVVVTFNYRLGALGFLSTENEYATGNWGLWDQQLALEFVKENIKAFRGDPDRITLCGEGAGASSVGIHLVSPISRGKGFYHQAVMMSGSDLSSFAYIRPAWRPREYTTRLAKLLNCPTHHSYDMVQCLRDSNKHKWQEFVETQDFILPHDGVLGAVWAPVQDSSYNTKMPFLPETPYELRRAHEFEKVPLIIGLNTEDGAQKANDTLRGLENGMLGETFKTYVSRMIDDWLVQEDYKSRAYEAIEFQYTYWPDPENSSARTQEFINMLTDLQVGVGMDQVIKMQSLYEPTYVYQFNYKSWNDWLPRWMGVSYSAALPYVFGFPYLNETVVNETELIPRQWYDYEDRNISDWMMYLWTNFAKYGYA